jgi:hypothetical protein
MIKTYIIHAEEDRSLCLELEEYLSALERNKDIEIWHEGKINIGDVREDMINLRLEASQLFILLISVDLMSTDTIYQRQLKAAREKVAANKAKLLPVLARECPYEDDPFLATLAVVPDGKKAIQSWDIKEEAYTHVSEKISGLVNAMLNRPANIPGDEIVNSTSLGITTAANKKRGCTVSIAVSFCVMITAGLCYYFFYKPDGIGGENQDDNLVTIRQDSSIVGPGNDQSKIRIAKDSGFVKTTDIEKTIEPSSPVSFKENETKPKPLSPQPDEKNIKDTLRKDKNFVQKPIIKKSEINITIKPGRDENFIKDPPLKIKKDSTPLNRKRIQRLRNQDH